MPTSTSHGRARSGENVAHLRHKSSVALTPGTMLGRVFRVDHKIATGGMGEVWSGEHVVLHLRVAIKILRPEASAIAEVVTRFQREAFLLAQIRSEHVARIIDFIEGRQGPVLVMELVEGPALAKVLASKRFAVEEAIELGIDIASALREVHASNVVHRDVKPANIILRPLRDGSHRAVFVDLGVSRMVTTKQDDDGLTEITSEHRAVGTVEYMAPEQILCSHEATAGADLYSLGAILFRAVAGRNVFSEHGAPLMHVKLTSDPPPLETGRGDRVAHGFEAVVARLLARRPEDRYESADELLADLSLLRDAARHVSAQNKLRSTPPPLPSSRSVRALPATLAEHVPPPPLGEVGQARARWRLRAAMGAAVMIFAAGATLALRGLAATTPPTPSSASATPPPSPELHRTNVAAAVPASLASGHCALLAQDVDQSAADGRRHMTLSLVCDPERP
jgi:serine/threonine protein kinase